MGIPSGSEFGEETVQLTLLPNNEQEQLTAKTCLAPDTRKAEMEEVRGVCTLGNKKNVLLLILTAALEQ